MAKSTLLAMVQEILNDLDSDEVNSIDDTVESQQVANILKSCYNEIISSRDWPHLRKLIMFDSSATLDKPTHMRLPENVKQLEFFKYNQAKATSTDQYQYQEVKYKYPDDFLRYLGGRNSTNDNVSVVLDFSGTPLLIYNDKAPQYWTSFDDSYIVCDAYDMQVDDTLKASKTQCLAYTDPVWVHSDNAVPNLPTEAFAALIEEAKSTAFVVLKQETNAKAEQKAVRQQKWLSRKAWSAHGGIKYANYGRRRVK